MLSTNLEVTKASQFRLASGVLLVLISASVMLGTPFVYKDHSKNLNALEVEQRDRQKIQLMLDKNRKRNLIYAVERGLELDEEIQKNNINCEKKSSHDLCIQRYRMAEFAATQDPENDESLNREVNEVEEQMAFEREHSEKRERILLRLEALMYAFGISGMLLPLGIALGFSGYYSLSFREALETIKLVKEIKGK